MLKKEKEILNKYIDNTANVNEQAKAEAMLREEKKGIKDYMASDWKEYLDSDEDIEKDLSGILDKVHHTIHLNDNEKKITLTRRLYKWYSAAAAIIIIPLMLAGITSVIKLEDANKLLSENTSTVFIESPKGSRISFNLPDGSEVALNGGSSLKYSVPFSNNRDVKLMGEAYFDIKHDEKHPFVVSAKEVDVRVLGTRFNVNAFPDEDLIEVILEQGKVECSIGQEEIIMKPNEQVSLIGNHIKKKYVNAKKYTAWRNGKLVFRGDSMDEVARRISRWYNVDVDVKGAELKTYSIRATFQDDPLEEVLRLLKMSSPIEYKIVARKKQADGSFSKRRVIVYKKRGVK